jgi:hypothetical protein
VPLIPVAEAAEILGVDSRQVRRLAGAGLISGRRSSAGWLLDEDSVRRRELEQPHAGRPLSPQSAWALLEALDQVGVPASAAQEPAEDKPVAAQIVVGQIAAGANMDRHEARRLAERLGNLPDEHSFLNLVRRRADIQSYRVHPGVVVELAKDARISIGGAKALAALEGIAEGSAPLVAYVDASEGPHVIAKYRAKPDPMGNVQLAMTPRNVPVVLLPKPGKFTSASVTYTDALASDDARARGLASQWFCRIKESLKTGQPN